ncbi:MAG: Gfo/Idh/MocA family oxidoreductase [Clostridia bacterium]|nr:Gfo/Idh/MocA family oxidoreductase [Clostridia bacterium]
MRKINWGVLGTAGIARGQTIPGMVQAENCHLYAIAGRSMEKAQAYQAEFGFERAYDSYDALLNDPKVEAVYIPLPNHLHVEWAMRALKAGKHVLCEKPLAPTAAEAAALVACAEANGVYLMEAYAYLHSPLTAAVKAELPRLGRILYMDSSFMTSDYDVSNIRMRRETFGGALYDLGCYCTTQIQWLLGEAPDSVKAVATFSDRNVDACTTGLLTFPSGARATFSCGMVLATEQDKRIDRCIIHGERGYIVNDSEFNQCGELKYTVCVDGVCETKTVMTPHNYKLEVEQLGRCVAGEETPFVTNAFSLQNARVMDEALKSMGY